MNLNSDYIRVVPRDLFNEADLLKMLGKVVIFIMEEAKLPWEYEHDNQSFKIAQDESDGSIQCTNLKFFISGHEVKFTRPLNCRTPWTLYAEYLGQTYQVFDSKGRVDLESQLD